MENERYKEWEISLSKPEDNAEVEKGEEVFVVHDESQLVWLENINMTVCSCYSK